MYKLALVTRREKTDMGRTEQLYAAASNAVCTVTVALRAAQHASTEDAGAGSHNASRLRDLEQFHFEIALAAVKQPPAAKA